MRWSIGILIATSMVLVSCEKESAADVNPAKVYTDYELFYDKNTDKSWAIARFRFGGPTGTLLELDSTDNVSFNGADMPYNFLIGGHFLEYAGFISSGTFSYTDLAGATYVNSLPAFDSIGFQTGFDTIVKSVANTLAWTGTPLAPNQNVGVFVGSWTWGQDALYYQEGDGAQSLVMGTGQLSTVPVGPAVVYMDRSTDVGVAQGTTEGGRIRGKYRALNRTVQVVP